MPSSPRSDLPAAVAAFVHAVNAGQLDAVLDTFDERALVNDQLTEYSGRQAIRGWLVRDVVGVRLRLSLETVATNHDHTVATMIVDGDFDKRGLPQPLVITFYFSGHEDKLTQLVILRNETPQ